VAYYSRLDRKSDAARELLSGIDPTPSIIICSTSITRCGAGRHQGAPAGHRADVIHSWWVPDFGVKKDAIPGFVNEAWFRVDTDKPGLYRGQCAELCGRDHGFMPIVVDVRTKADFATWLKDKAAELKQAAAPPAAPAVPPAAAPADAASPRRDRILISPNASYRAPYMAEPLAHAASTTTTTSRTAGGAGSTDQPQRHRHHVPDLRLHDVLHRGGMAMLIRLELFRPGLQFFDPQFFNSMTTMHALIMIFGAVMPAWTGLANWMIPMQIGRRTWRCRASTTSVSGSCRSRSRCCCRRCSCPAGRPRRLDHVPAAGAADRSILPDAGSSHPPDGRLLDSRRINVIVTIVNMRAPGMMLLRIAAVRVDLADHRLPADRVMPVLGGAVETCC